MDWRCLFKLRLFSVERDRVQRKVCVGYLLSGMLTVIAILVDHHRPRPAYPLASTIRVYCMPQWFGLSDPAMEEALYEIASMRRFADFSMGSGSIPDETTILNFRHLLEKHGMAGRVIALINQYLVSVGYPG